MQTLLNNNTRINIEFQTTTTCSMIAISFSICVKLDLLFIIQKVRFDTLSFLNKLPEGVVVVLLVYF